MRETRVGVFVTGAAAFYAQRLVAVRISAGLFFGGEGEDVYVEGRGFAGKAWLLGWGVCGLGLGGSCGPSTWDW